MIRIRLPAIREIRRVAGPSTVGALGLKKTAMDAPEAPAAQTEEEEEVLYAVVAILWAMDEDTLEELPIVQLDDNGLPEPTVAGLYDATPGFEIPCGVIPPQAFANEEPVSRGRCSYSIIDIATGLLIEAADHEIEWARDTISGTFMASELYPDIDPGDDHEMVILPPSSEPSSFDGVSEDTTPHPVFVAACGVCEPYPDGWIEEGPDGPSGTYFWVRADVDGKPARPAVFSIGLSG